MDGLKKISFEKVLRPQPHFGLLRHLGVHISKFVHVITIKLL